MKIIRKISNGPIVVAKVPLNVIIVLTNVMNLENLGRVERRIDLDEISQNAESFGRFASYSPFLALNKNKKDTGKSISSYSKKNTHTYGEVLLPGSIIELENDNNK